MSSSACGRLVSRRLWLVVTWLDSCALAGEFGLGLSVTTSKIHLLEQIRADTGNLEVIHAFIHSASLPMCFVECAVEWSVPSVLLHVLVSELPEQLRHCARVSARWLRTCQIVIRPSTASAVVLPVASASVADGGASVHALQLGLALRHHDCRRNGSGYLAASVHRRGESHCPCPSHLQLAVPNPMVCSELGAAAARCGVRC